MIPLVIEIQDNAVLGATVCKDGDEAEKVFRRIALETAEPSKEDLECALEDGILGVGDGSICLHWANKEEEK